MDAISVPKTNAQRRITKMMAAGIIEKMAPGKKGRMGGLARYVFVGSNDN